MFPLIASCWGLIHVAIVLVSRGDSASFVLAMRGWVFLKITGHSSLEKESWAFYNKNHPHPDSSPFLDKERGSRNPAIPLDLLLFHIVQLQNLKSFYTSSHNI